MKESCARLTNTSMFSAGKFERLMEEKEEREMKECSFKPKVNNNGEKRSL